MSYRHTIQAGLESLREIEQLLGEFHEKDNIPSIELDLVLQKTRNFYDILLMLRQHQQELNIRQERDLADRQTAKDGAIGTGNRPEQKSQERSQETFSSLTGETDQSAASNGTGADPASGEMPPVDELPGPAAASDEKTAGSGTIPERKPAGQGTSPDETEAGDGKLKTEKSSKPDREATILSEKYSGRSSLYDSIHDAVSQRDGGPIGQVKPVSSIRSAIGINDRFSFIRELFNNDGTMYDNTIGILDEASNFNEAYNYMIQHFDWDMDSATVQQLLDIIRRKYITGRHE